jgi:hypothetical protein
MLYLDIADIEVRAILEAGNSLETKFADFLSNGKSAFTLTLEVSKRDFPALRGPIPLKLVDVCFADRKIVIEKKGEFKGYLNLDTLKGKVEVSFDSSFESFLRILYSSILPDRDGLAIHASSLVRDGKAYLFPGKSEAGKTTIARLSPDADLLTD